MKISLKLANGAQLEFEGDPEDFERVSEFLTEPPDSLTAGGDPPGVQTRDSKVGHADDGGKEPSPSLDPATVAAEFERLGVANDQERVTVLAHLARENGKEGIDFETVNHIFTELGLRKPAQFPSKTFANAKNSGLVQPVKPGIWRPTFRGENFARGHGRETC
jgi:hypothetical protein